MSRFVCVHAFTVVSAQAGVLRATILGVSSGHRATTFMVVRIEIADVALFLAALVPHITYYCLYI